MNPLKKGIMLKIDGEDYKLVFDFEAIADAEELTGKPLIAGMFLKDLRTPTVNMVRGMFYACAKADRPNLQYADVKKLVRLDNLFEVWAKVVDAWVASNPKQEEDDAANPNQGQK